MKTIRRILVTALLMGVLMGSGVSIIAGIFFRFAGRDLPNAALYVIICVAAAASSLVVGFVERKLNL